MHQNVPDKVVAKVHDKETNMTGSQKLSENVGVARWSAIGAAVVVALSLSACGGGGGGDSTTASSNQVAVSTPTAETTVNDSAVQNSGTTAVATDVGIRLAVLKDESGVPDDQAKVTLTNVDGASVPAVYGSDSKFLLTLPLAKLSATNKFVVTVSSTGRKPVAVSLDKSTYQAGNVYEPTNAVRLALLDSVALPVETLSPSSVYLGDGSIPTDQKANNQFSSTIPVGKRYTVDLGPMPAGVEGNYSTLSVSMLIRGLDSSLCSGDRLVVFQSDSKTGTRSNIREYVISNESATTPDAVLYSFPVKEATGFKAASGNLYAELAVDYAYCSGGTEYDDIEFSAVSASFVK